MGQHSVLFLLLLLLLSGTASVTSSAVHLRELETMMETLRPLGYTLFCNAITTSDIQLQIVSSKPQSSSDLYTIFAAKDPYLYALDMASDAAAYVSTLRYHVSPNRRLLISDLRNLESPFLETLLPHYSILVSVRVDDGAASGRRNGSAVRVDGVRISDPDLFVGSRIVVHGLDGILVTGIVRNDDLVDEESGLGLASAPTPEEGGSVVAPPSSPLSPSTLPPAPVVAPALPPEVIQTSPPPVVVEAPLPPVVIQAPLPPPFVVQAPPPPVVVQAPPQVVVQTPLTPVVVPIVGNASDEGKGLNERRRGPKHQSKGSDGEKKSKEARHGVKHQPEHKKETDGGKGSKEARKEKNQPAHEKRTDGGGKGSKETARKEKHQPAHGKSTDGGKGPIEKAAADGGKGMKEGKKGSKHKASQEKKADSGKGLKEGKRGAKHHSSQESEIADGKRLKEGRRGPKHVASQENEIDGGKGLKEGKRGVKHHRATHQTNRRRQTKRSRVHQKDDL